MEKSTAVDIFGPNLFNLSEDLFVIYDDQYRIIDVSQSSERILGFKAQDVIMKSGLDFIHPADRGTALKNILSLQDSSQLIVEDVLRLQCADETYRYMRIRSTFHPHNKNQLIAVAKDVHEEYLQIYLMKNTDTYAQMGRWQYNIKANKRIWSKSVYTLLEIPTHIEITDEVATRVYTPEGMVRLKKVLKEAIDEQKSWDIEQLMMTYTGKPIWIRSKGGPVVENGQVTFVEGIAQDIDVKKREEIRLKEAVQELDKVQQGINNHFVVCKLSPEGIFLSVNHNLESLTGYKKDELIGKHITILCVETDSMAKFQYIFNYALENKKWRDEICHKKKNGEYYWMDTTLTTIMDPGEKKVKEFIFIGYDVTVKKSNEEKLKVLIERLEYVLKGIDAGIWDWVDLNQSFVYWSPKTYELFGYLPGDIQPTQDFIDSETHPDDLYKLKEMFNEIIKKKSTTYRIELRIRVKSGQYRWFQSHTFLVTDENGNPKRLIGSLIDIDDRKTIENELVEETKKSVQSSKLASIGEIAAGVAHEVNNPLTIIFGFIRMIEEELKAEEINKELIGQSLETIKQAASRAAKIVTGLRDFSRDGANDPFEDLEVMEVLDMALTLCRERFKKSGVELKLDIRTKKSIHCRRVELSQVFLNLVMNAFDAVKTSEKPWIQVSTQEVPDFIEISFTDSGSGIPEDIREKIFQPFFTTKRFGSGTGLGLSIAKNIITNHRGEIFYDPSSQFTKFIIRLPKDY